MSEKTKILIVEDEVKIARFIQLELEHEMFLTEVESNGRTALDKIVQGNADLVLLDIMLPELDGIEICRRVREISDIPIIMLSARDEIQDKVSGLDIGADDYITKPFAIAELLARIRAALRSHAKRSAVNSADNPTLQFKELVIYADKHEVRCNGELIELTKKEYDLLEYLLRNQGLVRSREQILQDVWEFDYMGDTNIVDVYIRYLRTKIDERFKEKYIHTIRSVGYAIKN